MFSDTDPHSYLRQGGFVYIIWTANYVCRLERREVRFMSVEIWKLENLLV